MNSQIINGKQLATELLKKLAQKFSTLQEKPTLAVIQIGNDAGSTSYINQKKKKGEEVGINVAHIHFQNTINQQELEEEIDTLNMNPEITGIIIQRPLPPHIDTNKITQRVAREKDVDGFRADSPFTPPVALAVLHILSVVAKLASPSSQLLNFLRTQKIVILGRGETAGKPIALTFEKLNIPHSVIHSKTLNREELLHRADIIISCVGKGGVIQKEDLKPGVVLIGVGIHRVAAPSYGAPILSGDYDENEIKDIASFYTPTPGGVGPLTVAFLLKNLILHPTLN